MTKKDLKINFGQDKVAVAVKGEKKLDLQLFDKIRPDECNWTISKGKVCVSLCGSDFFSISCVSDFFSISKDKVCVSLCVSDFFSMCVSFLL